MQGQSDENSGRLFAPPRETGRAGIVTAGCDGICAGFARPQLGPGRLLERREAARVVHVRLRVQDHFDVPDVKAELRDARQDQRRGCGITAVDQDVTLGPGDEEGRDVVRADVVEIAGDAERLGGLLSTSVPSRLPCPQGEHGEGGGQPEQEDQHASPGEVPRSLSRFANV